MAFAAPLIPPVVEGLMDLLFLTTATYGTYKTVEYVKDHPISFSSGSSSSSNSGSRAGGYATNPYAAYGNQNVCLSDHTAVRSNPIPVGVPRAASSSATFNPDAIYYGGTLKEVVVIGHRPTPKKADAVQRTSGASTPAQAGAASSSSGVGAAGGNSNDPNKIKNLINKVLESKLFNTCTLLLMDAGEIKEKLAKGDIVGALVIVAADLLVGNVAPSVASKMKSTRMKFLADLGITASGQALVYLINNILRSSGEEIDLSDLPDITEAQEAEILQQLEEGYKKINEEQPKYVESLKNEFGLTDEDLKRALADGVDPEGLLDCIMFYDLTDDNIRAFKSGKSVNEVCAERAEVLYKAITDATGYNKSQIDTICEQNKMSLADVYYEVCN